VLRVDNLVQTLKTIAEGENPRSAWHITNTGRVIVVRASSAATFDNPDDAFAEARRMVRELTADGSHRLVNRADVGTSSEPVEVLLWPTDQIDDDHYVVEL
jgi:hypothetical protein